MPKLARPSKDKRKSPLPGKLHPLNMRTTAKIRERLLAAAEASGRSLAQEVEYRLERSFDPTPTLEKLLVDRYGEHGALLLLIYGREIISRVSKAGPTCDIHTDWLNNTRPVANVREFDDLPLKVLGAGDVAPEELRGEWGWLVALADPSTGAGFGKLLRDLAGEPVTTRAAERFAQLRNQDGGAE